MSWGVNTIVVEVALVEHPSRTGLYAACVEECQRHFQVQHLRVVTLLTSSAHIQRADLVRLTDLNAMWPCACCRTWRQQGSCQATVSHSSGSCS